MRPAKARNAPRSVAIPGAGADGGRIAGIAISRGTKTTTRLVIKADFAAVVRARPAV
jgi:hypothetical protein